MSKKTIIQLPLKTCSEANCSEHWTKKKKRHDIQKWVVKKYFKDSEIKISLPVDITLIRVSPKFLDAHDNLRCSMKWIVDQIALEITGITQAGRADDCKQITWNYDQKKGKVRENYIEVIIEEK